MTMRAFFVGLNVITLAGATLAGGTLTSGNASFNLVGNPVFSSNFGNGNLLTDPGVADQLFMYNWYYRTQFNNTNRLFSSLDTPSEVYSGDTATITYTNAGPGPAGQERFNAAFSIKLIDGANPGEAVVLTQLDFTNAATSPRTFQLFNLVDLDIAGSAANDTVQITDSGEVRARFTESVSGNYGEALGVGATAYQVGAGSTLRSLLGSGAANLNNSVGPFSGDGAAAFQWTLTLDPGQTVSITSSFSLNTPAIPEPATFGLLGLAALSLLRRR